MAILRLGVCVLGVYSMFLLWAIAQERLSVPFKSLDGKTSAKYHSVLFMGTCQSALSALSSLIYIVATRKPGQNFWQILGLEGTPSPTSSHNGTTHSNGTAHSNGDGRSKGDAKNTTVNSFTDINRIDARKLLLRYFQCALFITFAAPFGFAALSHISYPTMVLGKSCKLVPVMIMNVLLYRRKFAPHKYLVVFMVTAGITMFMGFGAEKSGKFKGAPTSSSSLIGVLYLLINLAIDGATNSTQDEIFVRYKVTGQQMMFWINVMCTLVTSLLSVLPLPYIPVLHPSNPGQSELAGALAFIREHPSIVSPLAQFAFTGSLGQLFIFETLQHFGSLTLVTITLTRKLFTMVLSVVVYNHKLTLGQWAGAAVVFAGISVEAWVKRKDVHAKRVVQEKEKAKIKSL